MKDWLSIGSCQKNPTNIRLKKKYLLHKTIVLIENPVIFDWLCPLKQDGRGIFITAGEFGFGSLSSQRQWEYLDGEQFVEIAGAQETYYELWPDGAYWGGQKSLTLRYSVELNHVVYLDTITIKKTTNSELYVVEVKSVTGDRFVNGLGSTVLSASVKYNGILLSEADVEARFELTWKKFKRDGSPDVNWGIQTGRSITVNASDVDEKGVFVVDLNLV